MKIYDDLTGALDSVKEDIQYLTELIEIEKLFPNGGTSLAKPGRKYLKSARIERLIARKSDKRVDANMMYIFNDLILFVSEKSGILSSKGNFRIEGSFQISKRFVYSEFESEEYAIHLKQGGEDGGYIVFVSIPEEKRELLECFRSLHLFSEAFHSLSHPPVQFHCGWLGKRAEKGLKIITRRWVEVTGELLCYFDDDSVFSLSLLKIESFLIFFCFISLLGLAYVGSTFTS